MDKYAVGVDVAWDRSHTTVAIAGHVKELTSVAIAAYHPGADTAGRVAVDLRARRAEIVVTVLDPKSPAVTLLEPLRKAGVRFHELTLQEAVEAHHRFLDELSAGRIRHDGHPALSLAMQHADVRHLGGGELLDRRRTEVDVSPLTAAQMAVFGLLRMQWRPPRVHILAGPEGQR